VKELGKKVALVPGPAIIHSGADRYLKEILQMGFIDVVLTGNAFAVHDIEKALLNTSLGVNQVPASLRKVDTAIIFGPSTKSTRLAVSRKPLKQAFSSRG
jgi:deoxyhypusine synthase